MSVLLGTLHQKIAFRPESPTQPRGSSVTAEGAVKLLDFGIAKLVDSESGNDAALTLDGGRVFTPQYAAPEQVRGEPLTTAADVYALGVLLYVLLSGRHPTGEACRTPAESIRAILESDPARLGRDDLDNILDKAPPRASTSIQRVCRAGGSGS